MFGNSTSVASCSSSKSYRYILKASSDMETDSLETENDTFNYKMHFFFHFFFSTPNKVDFFTSSLLLALINKKQYGAF